MVKQLIFHLGDCKTGSTSIQKTLSSGGVTIPGKTIYYRDRGNHNALATALYRPLEMPEADARFGNVRAMLDRQPDADIAIISAEAFEMADPELMDRMIRTHFAPWRNNMRMLAYIRPHTERLISGFAERSKQGGHLRSMDDLLTHLNGNGLLHFAPRIERWRKFFGDAYEVRPMVRSCLYKNDVVHDFLQFLAEGGDYSVREIMTANESLTLADLAALREMHSVMNGIRIQGRRRVQSAFGWNLAVALGHQTRGPGASKPRIDVATATRAANLYREDAETLDRLYFEGTPMADALDGAVSKALPEPQPIEAEHYFSPEGLRILRGIATLMGGMMAVDPEQTRSLMRSHEYKLAEEGALKGKGKGKQRRRDGAGPNVIKSADGQKKGRKQRRDKTNLPHRGAKKAMQQPQKSRPNARPVAGGTAASNAAPRAPASGWRGMAIRVAHKLPVPVREKLSPLARRLLR